jgi:AcrR family transcriptional regulator
MAQTKKDGVREAILQAAFAQFSDVGYSETSIPAIAAAAGISTANVYRYFPSKLAILYTLYEPWLVAQLDALGESLMRVVDPRKRLEKLLLALWRELPRASNGFCEQRDAGLVDQQPWRRLRSAPARLVSRRVAGWIAETTRLSLSESKKIAGVALMAFDGFAMNVHLPVGVVCDTATARLMARTIIGA